MKSTTEAVNKMVINRKTFALRCSKSLSVLTKDMIPKRLNIIMLSKEGTCTIFDIAVRQLHQKSE
ncbi:MAG: hypothetical protein WBP64_00435 [Nitrososphaeraceae archaeon]